MDDSDSKRIGIAWDRVAEVAGSKAILSGRKHVPVDRRDDLATALGSLRLEIRDIPEAEARLQKRLRWVDEHAGPGTQFHNQLKAVVAAFPLGEKWHSHLLRAWWEVRSAATDEAQQDQILGYRPESVLINGKIARRESAVVGAPIHSLPRLFEVEKALRQLSDLPNAGPQIAAAMETADQLIKVSRSEEIEAAVALVGIDEMGAGGRFGAIGSTGIVDSVPLGAVGRLVQQLIVGRNDPEWSQYLSPRAWQKILRNAGISASAKSWARFRENHGGQPHPDSGYRKVRFKLSELRSAGLDGEF